MSHNSFGHLFRVTTWGESHGIALGCVVDGCPPGIRFTLAEIQAWLDKRKPGQSRFVTQRREDDLVKVLSGVMLARGLAAAKGLPLVPVNHLAGHALTPRLTDGILFPYLMLKGQQYFQPY